MCYFSKLGHIAHCKAKNQNLVKTGSRARTHARTLARARARTHTPLHRKSKGESQ